MIDESRERNKFHHYTKSFVLYIELGLVGIGQRVTVMHVKPF